MEISIRYFTAIREEIRKNATENQSGIGPGGKGPIQQSFGEGKSAGTTMAKVSRSHPQRK